MQKYLSAKSVYCRFKFLLVILCCVLILAAGCKGEAKQRERVGMLPTHPSFVTAQELNVYIQSKAEKRPAFGKRIASAVVPHHLVAGSLIAGVMDALSPQEPELIVLVGPNHPNQGARIITGYSGWQTPGGVVHTNPEAVSGLIKAGAAVQDEEALAGEHSIGAIVPFIRHYLPQAKIVPVILHHDVSLQEVNRILKALEPCWDEKTVLISSVDFSHYLTRSEAQAKDQETSRYLKNFDYKALMGLGNDYLDSPVSLAAAFLCAEKQGITELEILENTNSGIILQNDFIETTSYFTLVFQK